MRKKLDLTQKELAKLTGLSQSYIARLEREDLNPTYESVKKIFTILDNAIAKKESEIIKAKDIMSRNVVFVKSDDKLEKTMKILLDHGFSQLPVIDNGVLVGGISESIIETKIADGYSTKDLKKISVYEVMDDPFLQISENTSIKVISYILKQYPAVIVTKKGKISGIITKSDILKTII
ncbi:MAG: CBS domain-containing protein [Thermoplasmata archaeon]